MPIRNLFATRVYEGALDDPAFVAELDHGCRMLAELGTATPGQIARATGLTTGAITGIVDRLEKLGYARREPSPTDRRSVIVHALRREELAAVMNPIFASLTAAMDALYARYTPEQLALIQSYLADTTETLQAETRKIEDSPRARS